ncbi:RNA-binding protein KhpA, partial [Dysosmobacter welbionis]
MVRSSFFRESSRSRRLFLLTVMKPSKVNRPVGRPLTARAFTAAQQPGMESTSTPFSAHSRTRSSPGSEMAGVPASVT